jgi:hypothetical protein
VRQRCGFGCVVCGCPIYQYHHLDPPFAEARTHDPDGIILLCGACHNRKTRGLLSEESVRHAAEHPRALQTVFSFGPFDFGTEHPEVVLGALRAIRTSVIVRAFGDDIPVVGPPEAPGGPFRLSAVLCDSDGLEVIHIVENEWRTSVENWDVQVSGRTMAVRSAPRNITLRLRSDPPRSLIIEHLEMFYRGAHLVCKEDETFRVRSPAEVWFHSQAGTVSDCDVALEVTNTGILIGKRCRTVCSGVWSSAALSLPVSTCPGRVRNMVCPCNSGLKFKSVMGGAVAKTHAAQVQ